MAAETAITNGLPAKPQPVPEEHRWFPCARCGGAVGVPSDWSDATAECPHCKAAVPLSVSGRVLYRPPVSVQPAVPEAVVTRQPEPPRVASTALTSKAEAALIGGLLSVVFGWTFIVPVFGLAYCFDAATIAKKEGVPIPAKVTWGLALAILFGGAQCLSVIVHIINAK